MYILFLFHTISFVSSSFIEEEHQTWYYMCHTMFTIICLKDLRLKNDDSSTLKWIFFFAMHLVLRRFNQTGDKWINLPDIGDYVVQKEKSFFLNFVLGFGLLLVYVSLEDFFCRNKIQQLLVTAGLVSIFIYRAEMDIFHK